jgi:pilus assembly protein Flp/PilA
LPAGFPAYIAHLATLPAIAGLSRHTDETRSEESLMNTLITRFAKDESGATAIEYGLIATLIGVAIILGATTLGTKLNSTFNYIAGKLTASGT